MMTGVGWRCGFQGLMLMLTAVCLLRGACGVRPQELFPFGEDQGDQRLPIGDDEHSQEFQLRTPIAFYDYRYGSIYINTNGVLSFEREYPAFYGQLYFPVGVKVIAPFLADVDTRLSGNVFYRETADPSLLELVNGDIQRAFTSMYRFRAYHLLIVTWQDVGYYRQQYDRTNTFQVAVASDGVDSFVFFLYEDGRIEWVESQGKGAPVSPDLPAYAGFDVGDLVRYHTLPGSGEHGVENIGRTSNMGVPGKWAFHVGLLDSYIEEPDSSGTGGNTVDPYPGHSPASCASEGAATCHASASCRDEDNGYCCQCVAPAYGNGRTCFEPVVALRINGKVSGIVNGHTIGDQEMHAYVLTKDGRSYTALSRLEESVGAALQAAYPIGGVIGLLFAAARTPGAKNGAMVTGANLNRTAVLRYQPGSETLQIYQQYVYAGRGSELTVTTTLSGTIPEIEPGAEIRVNDYVETYTRDEPGVIRSSSQQTYTVGGLAQRFQLDDTLQFQEPCSQGVAHDPTSIRLTVQRPFIVYGRDEEIVRYATTNKVTVGGGGRDPCKVANNCDPKASCTSQGQDYTCRCNQGYQGDGFTCYDVDECSEGTSGCDVNAHCYNNEGGYDCRCSRGYTGDGRTCERDLTCADLTCDVNAACIFDSDAGRPACQCSTGYDGDGTTCKRITFSCNEVDTCDDNADCVYDPSSGEYQCECMDGFSGDGYYCSDTGGPEISCANCDVHARCAWDVNRMFYRCQCMEGYTGDGYTCTYIGEAESCDVLNNCDYNARCIWDGRYVCQCNPGYTGDGYRCQSTVEPPGPSECEVDQDCHAEAACTYDQEHGTYACQCNEGFTGDGYYCEEENCQTSNFCDINAQCVYETYSQRYICRCDPGFEGDGRYCRQEGDCSLDSGLCDAHATCTRRGTVFVCACNQGYRGDGRRCAPMGDAASYLIYAQGMAIMQVPFQPTDEDAGKRVLDLPGQTAIGIAIDCYSRNVYWTDVSGKTISKATLDGEEVQVLISGLGSPEGVAIDWLAKNIYWTDSSLDRVEVARLDGTQRTTLFDTELVNPRAIVLDPGRGMLFFSDWNRDAPKIESAYMDGTNRQIVVQDDLGLPNGLTLDDASEQLCWADAGTQNIECVSYDGRGRRVVYAFASYPFDLVFANDIFYWSDWDMSSLANIDKYGGDTNDALVLPEGGNGRLYGLTAVHEQCPRVSNACVLNNGGCRFLCLPTPNGGRTCLCPGDIPEEECNQIGLVY